MTSKPNTPNTARENISSAWNTLRNLNFSQGREIKGTIYNIGAVAGVSTVVAFIFVLLPFLKPLLWALLIGAVVYPLKRKMSSAVKMWFEKLEQTDGNLFVNIAMAPAHSLDSLGEVLADFLRNHKHLILIGLGGLSITRLTVEYAPRKFLCVIWRAIVFSHTSVTNVLGQLSAHLVVTFLVAYFATVVLFWKPTNHTKFMMFGQSLWLLLVAYICSFLGPLQVPVFMAVLIYATCGTIYSYRMHAERSAIEDVSITEHLRRFVDVPKQLKPSKEQLNTSAASKAQLDAPPRLEIPVPSDTETGESDLYFKILFLACGGTIIFRNMWLLVFSAVPICMHFTKEAMSSTGSLEYLNEKIIHAQTFVENWISERYTAVFPICLPGVIMINRKVHRCLRDNLKSSVDTMSSIAVIVLMLVVVISAGVFLAVQIYSEGIAVAQLGHEVIQKAFIHRPELKDMFPESTFDNIIDNAHEYGRNTIETYIDDILKDTDKQQATKLKEQVLTTWDRLVQNVLERNGDDAIGPKMGFGIRESFDEIVDNPAAKEGIIAWAKSNVGMLKDVMDSLWIILQKNMYLLGTVLGSIFSVLLGGGHAVVTFVVDTIVFFTALFYLLCSSEDRYSPLVFVTSMGFQSAPRVAEAIEGSIAGVIAATAKIALFHGLFTWLTHTMFSVNVVYLPAVLATVLAAAPFLGTYWCAVPAFFDLWLAQDRFWMAVILLALHFFIPSTVDAVVYAEIKSSGHPYLTGLSIAGGLYWLGLQGAVIGPLLLCLLVMIFDLTVSAVNKESPITNSVSSTK
uniref:Putative conserved plasma membrane protein n=1 Tax=Nyssomyia neivai TaxID=330878 RepID=A0A1L8D908_9DIPT